VLGTMLWAIKDKFRQVFELELPKKTCLAATQNHTKSHFASTVPSNQPFLMTRNEVKREPNSSGQTRSRNATTHPGAILQDAQHVRWPKEEIAKEKELKNIQMEANVKSGSSRTQGQLTCSCEIPSWVQEGNKYVSRYSSL
jgi:hypothetical protein